MLSSGTIFCKPHHRPEPRLPGMLFPISLRFSTFSEIKRMKTATSPIFVGLFNFLFYIQGLCLSGGHLRDLVRRCNDIHYLSRQKHRWNLSFRKIKPQPCWWADPGFVLPSLDGLAKTKTWKVRSAVSTDKLFWNKSPLGVIELAMSITGRRGKEEGGEDKPPS